MKIIDFERKGNLIRFYLGRDDDNDYQGDNWDKAPYESSSEDRLVHDRYIVGYTDVVFPFDAIVVEPSDGHKASRWSKNDMKARRVPCIAVMMPEVFDDDEYTWIYDDDFDRCMADERSIKFRFGDAMERTDSIEEYRAS